jgi:hypothetical protein
MKKEAASVDTRVKTGLRAGAPSSWVLGGFLPVAAFSALADAGVTIPPLDGFKG